MRSTNRETVKFASSILDLESDEKDGKDDKANKYPGDSLGEGLNLAADLLATDQGIRIVHGPMNADSTPMRVIPAAIPS